ncbi:MAG: aminotransferase class V-fold PLP-dependent enzyme [Comamonadaceae bacterium]|nr:aminotransferase class V-fold PLP-dependent enzyme [Comamonadaceae bacterium]
MFAPVYFDHNATTPLDPRVLEAMLPYLTQRFGNASSRHEYGRAARRAVDEARQQVAAAVGAHPTEVIFCSGGSEANNLFIKGAAAMMRPAAIAHQRHRASVRARTGEATGARGLAPARDRGGCRRPARHGGVLGRCCAEPGENRVGDAGQQRDRRAAVCAGARGAGARCACLVPYRRGAGAGQDQGRFPGAGRARPDAIGPQAERPAGRGGAGDGQARRAAAADRRRRTGTRLALRAPRTSPAIVGFGRACELAATALDAERVAR